MRKKIRGRKFHRRKGPRLALLKNLAENLILYRKIVTTEAKAKELSVFIEKKITKAKKGDISSRRLLSKYFSPRIVKKLIEEIAPSFKQRRGGYTRIMKLESRKSDGAKMAIIELVGLAKPKSKSESVKRKEKSAKK